MHFKEQITAASALLAVAYASPIAEKRADANKDFLVRQSWVQKSTVKSGPKAYASVFTKYGKEIPADIAAAAAANDGVVVTTPTIYDSEYLTPVTIGGQTVNLDFDTGSSDLWVFSSELPTTQTNGHDIYDPSKSTTSKKLNGYTWSITYGDKSSSSGDVYTDTVSVGVTTFQNQAVELAQKISGQFQQDVNNDGLLGLAFSSINTVKPQKQLTFFDNVKSSLSAPIFAVDLKKGRPGTYAFGTTDASKYTGAITYTNVDNSQGFWSFTTSGYAVGNGAVNTQSISGIADTGTTLLLIPDSVVRAYYARVSGARNDPQQGGYTFPCSSTLPSISFQIGSYRATVPGNYINYAPIDDSGVTCFGGIQSSRGIGINIFGDIFLKSQYVVFEGRATPRLGFAAKPL